MRERENLSIRKIVRNSVAAVAVAVTPGITLHSANAESVDTNHTQIVKVLPQQQEYDLRIFEQVDEFMETNTGKTLAGLFLMFAALNMVRTIHHSYRLDNKRKFAEAIGASSSLLALSAALAVSTVAEIDPKIPASLLISNATFQAAYSIEDELQRWRGLHRVAPTIGMATTLFGIGTALLVDSLK